MTDLEKYQKIRIEALEQEVLRLNEELVSTKQFVSRIRLSEPTFKAYNPDFDKKISELNQLKS